MRAEVARRYRGGDQAAPDESWRDASLIAAVRNGNRLGSFERQRLLELIASRTAIDVGRLAAALRAIHGDRVPLPNRPSPAEYAVMLGRWYDEVGRGS